MVSPLGLWAARRLPNAPLAVIFAGVLGWVAWRMWRGAVTAAAPALPALPAQRRHRPLALDRACARALGGTGVTAGFLSACWAWGRLRDRAGAASRHRPAHAGHRGHVAGGDRAGVGQRRDRGGGGGHLEWRIALPFTLAAVAGMLAGRAVADRFPPRRLQQSFALFAAVVAAAMLVKGLSGLAG